MSETAVVKQDASTLSWLDRRLFALESACNLAAGLTILAAMLLAVAQILGRKFFNQPVPGFIDWIEQGMVVFAFAGIAYCQRLGGHVRMELVINRFSGATRWGIEAFGVLLTLLLTVVLIYGSWSHFLRAYNLGDSSIDIALPIWPAKLIVPVALAILALRLMIQLWGYCRCWHNPAAVPIAVPLPQDIDYVDSYEG